MRFLLISALAILMAAPMVAQQQDNSGSTAQPTAPAAKKKSEAQKKTSAAQANPFPEAQSEKAQQQDQQPPQAPAAPAPNAPQPKRPSAAEANPFPEAESEKAAHQAQQAAPPSQQDSSSSQVQGLEPPGWAPTPVPKASGGFELNAQLGKKDTQVGHFYLQSGDYKGAYDRYLEATKVDPGNAEAVFGLAQAAQRLDMRDVAVRNYRLYLDALPNGHDAKEARKALKELKAGS